MVNSFPGAVGTVTWLLSIGGGIDEEADKKLDNEGIEARTVLERSILEEADEGSDRATDDAADEGDNEAADEGANEAADEGADEGANEAADEAADEGATADNPVELDNGDEAPTTGDVK